MLVNFRSGQDFSCSIRDPDLICRVQPVFRNRLFTVFHPQVSQQFQNEVTCDTRQNLIVLGVRVDDAFAYNEQIAGTAFQSKTVANQDGLGLQCILLGQNVGQ